MLTLRDGALRRSIALAGGCLLTVLVVGAARPAPRTPGPRGTIVFASDRSGTTQIYSVRADGSRLGQLTRGSAADTAPLFSPDGRRIVFNRAAKQHASELWIMNADGSGQRKLTSSGSEPAWSPDSRRLAYIDTRESSTGPIVITNPDGGGRLVVPGVNSRAWWSPNGRLLAFSRAAGNRIDLVVVGSDGRGLRTIRRNAVAVGWSPRGEIAVVGKYGSAIGVIGADGRGARRLLRSRADSLSWSPDGRRLAFVDGKGLHVASAAGRRVRDVKPKGADGLDAPTWSPDSRWIVARGHFPDTAYHGLVVLAADGSSSRRLTTRVPYPWGSENGPPSWRPRGATAGRLGAPPTAPPPSETVSKTGFEVRAPYTIRELSADGSRAALIVGRGGCSSVELWEPSRARVVRPEGPCGEGVDVTGNTVLRGVALAGTRVAWLHSYGANVQYTDISTATLDHPTPALLDEESANGGGFGLVAGEPVGDGGLLAFTVSSRCDADPGSDSPQPCPPGRKTGDVDGATIWRFGGRTRCGSGTLDPEGGPQLCTAVAHADGELRVLAVDSGRIAAGTGDGVRLLSDDGKLLRDLPAAGSAAALSGNRLALRTVDAVEVYDTGSGRRTDRFPVPRAVKLDDLEGDILVTASGATVTLRRLGDGRTTEIHTRGAAQAELEQPGLFVAGIRRVTFMSMQEVLRRLRG
jgi:dipeptidyl aminopeptidase/acylaminoacyl peptidase